MMGSLRRRFIISGMSAFAILLLVLLSGIALSGGLRVEKSTQAGMQAALNQWDDLQNDIARQKKMDRRHGWMETPMGYYLVEFDAKGEIGAVSEKGIWEPDVQAAQALAAQVLETGRSAGRIEGYRFLLERDEQGVGRLVLLDNSMQVHMLLDLLQTASLLSLACLMTLFLILLPISTRVVRSYARHIEKQKQFITNAGHDIKTPVAIIMSNLDAMELIQGENKWSRNIRGQSERLRLLLERLLFMARIDESSVSASKEALDLNALLGAELETYGEIIGERQLRLDCDLSVSVRVKAGREYMQQLAHVLLDNAVQYANSGGYIRLHLEKRHRKAKLLLENSVDALPDCSPDALFDRFYRGDAARTQSGGCGIGLSAARAICEMYRGKISAEYVGEKQIRFIVELPLSV